MANDVDGMNEILDYYNQGAEDGRLERGIGKIEFERTKEIISRYLPKERQVIYDIGGGVGIYSKWLAEKGHQVHLMELSPDSVKVAQDNNNGLIHSIEVADAREIPKQNDSADIVLLMGPMYHLVERNDRLKALKEALRVLKKDGIIIMAVISKFSSTLWGLSVYGDRNDFIEEPEFKNMIEQELTNGQHIRPDEYPYFIARSFFHLPNELKEEIEEVGLVHEKTLAVEGPAWIVPAFDEKWSNQESREILLQLCKKVEEEENIIGMSPHLLAVAHKKG